MTTKSRTSSSILVLGAGELGMAMLRALVSRAGADHDIAVLLRPLTPASGPTDAKRVQRDQLLSLGVRVIEGDLALASVAALSAIVRPFETVICCAGFVGGAGTQRKITAAVIEAGIKRYVPWQFGVDYDLIGRGSGQEVWDEQLDVRDMLRAQSLTE